MSWKCLFKCFYIYFHDGLNLSMHVHFTLTRGKVWHPRSGPACFCCDTGLCATKINSISSKLLNSLLLSSLELLLKDADKKSNLVVSYYPQINLKVLTGGKIYHKCSDGELSDAFNFSQIQADFSILHKCIYLFHCEDWFAFCATVCIFLQILCVTFRFLQFVFPAVALAPDELPLLQAFLDRAESEHIKPSILSWKQNKKLFCFFCTKATLNLLALI